MFDMLEVIFYEQHSMATVRGCCRFIGFTTTVYPLRVEVGFLEMP